MTKKELETIGKELSAYGWQTAIANMTGMHRRMIVRYLAGETPIPIHVENAIYDEVKRKSIMLKSFLRQKK